MSSRVARQAVIVALTLTLWASVGRPELLAALLAYLVAIALISTPPARALIARVSTSQLSWLALVIALPGLTFAFRSSRDLAEREGLHGLARYVGDRVRLEVLPAIAPALVVADHPQTFFIQAPDARRVEARFGVRSRSIPAESLGEGLFRVDYDPRRDGLPWPANGTLKATLTIDGEPRIRELVVHTTLAHPRWLTLSPGGRLAATVSEETDELIVVDARGLTSRTKVEDGPSDCAFISNTQIATSYLDATALQVIDLTSEKSVASIELGARQARVSVSPKRTLLAVALAGAQPGIALVSIDASVASSPRLALLERVALDATPDWLAFGVDEDTLIVSTRRPAQLLRLRRTGRGYVVDARLPLARPVVSLGRTDDGSQVLLAVTAYEADGQPRLGNHFVQDTLLSLDVARMQLGAEWLTARRSERQTKPGDVDRGLSPMGMAAARDGGWLVSFAGSDELWRVSAAHATPTIFDLAGSSLHAPHGVAELADGTLVVSSPSEGALGLLSPGATQPRVIALADSDAALLKRDRTLLAKRVGERGFYEGTRSGISCQSCHLHADSDDSRHNLGGHTFQSTLSVRGLTATAPYLRDGSYPRIADLEELAQTLYRGYLRKQGARGETLEAYLESLARPRHPATHRERDREGERRGLRAFAKAGCPTCHAPPAFTNLGALPSHTLFPDFAAKQADSETLDTPSLLSLASSAPYLSDGRAATLEQVLTTHNRRNRHGDTASLDAAERRDLVTFLSSL